MRDGPNYRIGAPIVSTPRTHCEVCGVKTNDIWLLRDGRSACTPCRKLEQAEGITLTPPAAA